jgi:hypothetical protein
MGRWAQARHRGRGNCVAPAFPLEPPKDDEWEVGPGAVGEVLADIIGGTCVAGADGWEFTYSLAGNPPDLANISGFPCGDQADLFPPAGSYDGFARWTNGSVAVSDWSTPKSFDVSA